MLFKYYFRNSSLPLLAIATIFDLLFLSVGDPGLPRFIKLGAFGIFFFFFLFFVLFCFFFLKIKVIIIVVFLYLYLLIKPFKVVVKILCVMLWPALDCVLLFRTYYTQNYVSNRVVSSQWGGSGQVCVVRRKKSRKVPEIL